MAKTARTAILTIGFLALGSLLVGAASAHATHYSPDGKIKFVYGHLNEPAYTFVKTGLDLSIIDNATGKGISGLDTDARGGHDGDAPSSPKLTVLYRYGAEGGPTKDISADFRAQHGQVGKYTHPITFTRPGLYSIIITGTINGTVLNNFVIAPAHAIEGQEDIMWPDSFDSQAELEERVKALEAQRGSDDDPARGSAPGIELLPLLAAFAILAVAVRRR